MNKKLRIATSLASLNYIQELLSFPSKIKQCPHRSLREPDFYHCFRPQPLCFSASHTHSTTSGQVGFKPWPSRPTSTVSRLRERLRRPRAKVRLPSSAG